MYVKEHPGKWEDYLQVVEFAYNDHYQASARYSPFEILYGNQASARYSPFEILYGRKCNTPISWSNLVDRLLLGPELLKEMELIVKQVQGNLKIV